MESAGEFTLEPDERSDAEHPCNKGNSLGQATHRQNLLSSRSRVTDKVQICYGAESARCSLQLIPFRTHGRKFVFLLHSSREGATARDFRMHAGSFWSCVPLAFYYCVPAEIVERAQCCDTHRVLPSGAREGCQDNAEKPRACSFWEYPRQWELCSCRRTTANAARYGFSCAARGVGCCRRGGGQWKVGASSSNHGRIARCRYRSDGRGAQESNILLPDSMGSRWNIARQCCP
mmetsp:Transcript_100349/g.158208  ORF Transcript_100349/g.158208 Transcript_100349/m.158208 type:complete len:233 (-) Transcript_100349:218-916(-)